MAKRGGFPGGGMPGNMANLMKQQGIARKEAMKLVAKDRGVTKRDIYQYLLGKESYNDF